MRQLGATKSSLGGRVSADKGFDNLMCALTLKSQGGFRFVKLGKPPGVQALVPALCVCVRSHFALASVSGAP